MTEVVCQASLVELPHIKKIWSECWPEPFDSPDTKEMPHFAPLRAGDASILYVDGEPVSCVAYGRRELMIGSSRMQLGALGDVATKTPCQRRGYASRLMVEAVHQMAARGDHVSVLFTFSNEYYRRFGWEVGGDSWGMLLYPSEFAWDEFALPPYQSVGEVRPFRGEDLGCVAGLQQSFLERRGWGLVRPAAYWRWARDWLGEGRCVVHAGSTGLEGYLVAEVTPRLQLPDEYTFRRRDEPTWPREIGPVLHVVEMVVSTPSARRTLVGHLASRAKDCAALAFPLTCHSDLEACGLLVPPARLRIVPAFMFRVLDVVAALRALRDLPAPGTPFSMSVLDPIRPEGAPVALRPSSDGIDVLPGMIEDHHLRMDIKAFSQILAGYRRPSDLRALGRLQASSEQAVSLADQVFIPREPFIGELDLF